MVGAYFSPASYCRDVIKLLRVKASESWISLSGNKLRMRDFAAPCTEEVQGRGCKKCVGGVGLLWGERFTVEFLYP